MEPCGRTLREGNSWQKAIKDQKMGDKKSKKDKDKSQKQQAAKQEQKDAAKQAKNHPKKP
jgi:hypothetical protein